ncbi:MAG: cob(I)yrinic acid a,c-diamide adenosyltransferase [Armatimonadota bacterium]|nr:cob(I)yrinic acid a,c-diamide adenosyltransferase [Armatimonadota bacterium]MDR7534124.1 cob(I)yrinic acid a,c-diamide adenosyltransferase [Armatimonadota bacterium]
MPRIYTRTGDAGETGLLGGRRVSKDDPRVEAYGTVDEANSVLGLLAAHLEGDLAAIVYGMQRVLFAIGAELATPAPSATSAPGERVVPAGPPAPDAAPGPARAPAVRPEDVAALEALIDAWEADLPPLRQFVLPGGSAAAALCQVARSVVRRAERRVVTLGRSAAVNPEIVRYLNRLSDALFVLARWLNHREGRGDVPWEGRGRG